MMDWGKRRTYLQIGERIFPWSGDVRDNHFERNGGDEDFVRFTVAPDGCKSVNGVVHTHRSLRDYSTTFRHFRENSMDVVEPLLKDLLEAEVRVEDPGEIAVSLPFTADDDL